VTPVQALQLTLSGEHAAVYVYGVLGARVSASAHPAVAALLLSAYTTHRARRDHLTGRVRAAGGRPVAAEVSYRLPDAARTVEELTRAALVIERRCASVYAAAVGSTAGVDRRWAVDALTDCAVRQLSFGGSPSSFPGAQEL
jgi:hypothetical protein